MGIFLYNDDVNPNQPQDPSNYFVKRMRAIGYAIAGICNMIQVEPYARIHLVVTGIVVTLGMVFKVTKLEWLCLVLALTGIWITEAFNTAIERLADRITLEQDPLIGQAKDIGAGAVLLACIGAIVVVAVVFYDYFLACL